MVGLMFRRGLGGHGLLPRGTAGWSSHPAFARIWYAFAPALAYVALTLAGVAFALHTEAATALLAAGICILLLAGIRNAWDMTNWMVLRR